jgi:transposase
MNQSHRQILRLFLDRLALIEAQRDILEKSVGEQLRDHADAVQRLTEVPGLGADSAQQIIAEVGPRADTFPSSGNLASWVGCCPGREESAEVSASDRSPKGNRHMRRLLSQAANSAARTKGSSFQTLYRRLSVRLGHNKAIWAVAHRICRMIWLVLHRGVRYEERGDRPNPQAIRQRTQRLLRALRNLGYDVSLTPAPGEAVA